MNGLPSIAQHLAAQGRNGDSVLVHMTPGEVRGLQAIAEQHGTSLTINPDTGLPEAFSLRSLLPMIAGAALTIGTGGVINPATAGMIVGGGTAIGTGSIEKGLMAGLGAYGGGSLAGAFSAPAAAAGAPVATTPGAIAAPGAVSAGATPATVGSITPGVTPGVTTFDMAGNLMPVGSIDPNLAAANFPSTFVGPSAQAVSPATPLTLDQLAAKPGAITSGITSVSPSGVSAVDPSTLMAGEVFPGGYQDPFARSLSELNAQRPFMDRFAQAAAGDGTPSMYKTALAGTGLMTPLYKPPKPFVPEEEEYNYEGPYTPSPREVRYPTDDEIRRRRTSEFTYFTPSNPVPFQEGGDVGMNVTPAEADVYRNIANVQRAAGIPSIANMPMMVHPQRDMRGLVYNPVEYVPSQALVREQNYGFAPLMSREEAEKNFESIRRRMPNDGTSTLREEDQGFKRGGVPMLEDGGFVLTKKAVDGLGKGDNKKGQKVASAGLGAIPIKGPGHGTSDSIPTTIEGKQPALVSNGEAYVPRRSVQKNGGAKKFYALMKAAERRA